MSSITSPGTSETGVQISGADRSVLLTWLAALAAFCFAASTIYHLSFYIRLPVDILGFEESDYITDLIKVRSGVPIYSAPTDNNSSVYTPGAQLLTYGIGRLLGLTAIPGLRAIQFSFVILAGLVCASASHLLARRFLGPSEYRGSAAWFALWTSLAVLVATEGQFNYNIHTLHPDSLTLFFTACAGWLVARYLFRPDVWVIVAMACLPAIGFWSKQSLLIWGPLFSVLLLFVPKTGWRRFLAFGVGASLLLGLSLLVLSWVGGPFWRFWIFDVLGDKQVSLARSAMNLLAAGGFIALSFVGLAVLAWHKVERPLLVGWGLSFALVLIEGYTSGIGWQQNHLGPGILLGMTWFFASVPRLVAAVSRERRGAWIWQAGMLMAVLATWGGFGLVRLPRNPVPADVYRYIAEINREFDGADPARTLLDRGSWVYWRDKVLMKDRASAVQLHVGKNQPQVNRQMLAGTIGRIEGRTYDRILVRYLDDGGSYDYQARGSGIRDALLANYREVRRIPGVTIDRWWPKRLLSDISVLEPITTGERATP